MATGGAAYGDLLITSLIVLAAVCVGGYLLVRVAGRWLSTGRTRGAHMMDVLARVPLEPRRSLYVVEVAGKTLLVGTSEMGLNVLTELDAGEVRARHVPQQSFVDLVRGAIQKRRKPESAEVPRDAAALNLGSRAEHVLPGAGAEAAVAPRADAPGDPGGA